MAAIKGKLKGLFTKKREEKVEDLDPVTQLARLRGVSEVKFPPGLAPGNELLVPSRFAALAQYIIDHAHEYTGVFGMTAHKATLSKLREHFIAQLTNAPRSNLKSAPSIIEAKLPYDKLGYTIFEVADCFKFFLSDLPGGILGDAALFESLRNNLPPVQLKPADLDLDFSCGGVEEAIHMKEIANTLRDGSSRERRNLILLVFGVLAVVRNDDSPIKKDTDDAISLSRTDTRGSGKSGLSQELSKVSSQQKLLSLKKKSSQILGLRKTSPNSLPQSASQNPSDTPQGSFVDPLEFAARSTSVSSQSRPPTPPPLRRIKTSGSIKPSRAIYTDPNTPPPLPDLPYQHPGPYRAKSSRSLRAPDFMSHSLVPESGPSDADRVSRMRSNSSGYSRYPELATANYGGEEGASVPSTSGVALAAESANLTSSKSQMRSDALGRIFASVLLGDETGNIILSEEGRDGGGAGKSTLIPGRLVGGGEGVGLRRLLRMKGEKGDGGSEKAAQRLRIAGWVVELLVRNWEGIVKEYESGIEGVDAMVEGLWEYDE